jgi:malonyl-CoA/methylmalonyl-CoA synthetase
MRENGAVTIGEDPGAWLPAIAARDPGAPFLDTAERCWSRGDMLRRARQITLALAKRGVSVGDRVAVQVEKSPEAAALYFACLDMGAVFVPFNTAYTLAELEYFLADCAPGAVIVDPAAHVEVGRLTDAVILTLDAAGAGSLAEAADREDPVRAVPAALPADALAALLYTSGTTGRSKGAMLTRGNLGSNAAVLVRSWRFTEKDVLLHALPVFHAHGLFVALNTIVAAGGSMLFLPRFDVDEVVRLLPRATVMMGVPTFYTRLLAHPAMTRGQAAHMRLFISGSAPLGAETHRAFSALTGQAILERYGMTETLMNTSNPYEGARIPGSVGPALPGVELRVVDLETGAPLAAGDTGMVEVCGPNLFKGYWRNPSKTAEDMRDDGFFVTGDIGRIDANGYLYLLGRGKDLIISGGYNVYPQEVEDEINALDGIAESAVIGVPHPDLGEAVVAVVVGRLAPDAIRAALRERLASYKLPKIFVAADALPRNAMSKVQKAALREAHAGLFA